MLVHVVIIAAAALQILAAFLALRVLRITGRQTAWLLIAIVTLLMAVRRCVVPYRLFFAAPGQQPPDLSYELLALAVSGAMALGLARVATLLVAIQRSAAELRQRTRELEERVRELNCLYAISTLVEQKGHIVPELCAGIAELIAASAPGPPPAACRVTVAGQSYSAGDFRPLPGALQAEVIAHGAPIGCIEVLRNAPWTAPDDQRSAALEGALLRATAERLGRAVERSRAAEERSALQRQLHELQKMEAVGQLAGGVAHDFNNLLTAILGHVVAARAQLAPDHAAQEDLHVIEQVTRQAGSVTDALLRFSSKLPTNKQPLDLGQVVRDTARLLHHSLPATIVLTIDAPPEPPLYIRADLVQMQQVILNLALNARDAMPAGGALRIAVARESVLAGAADDARRPALPHASLTVRDSGAGMSSDVQARIFDPFFTTKPREQGTGLGLSIVHGIVADHGGDIDVASIIGAGSTFTLRFPIIPDAPTHAGQAASTPPMPTGHGELILLAEGHQLVREIIVSTLQGLGYRTLSAADGTALLDCGARHAAELDLLLIDLTIRPPGGLECLRQLRAQGMTTPAVVLADGGTNPEAGLDRDTVVLYKPFDMQALAAVVRSLLAGSAPEELPS